MSASKGWFFGYVVNPVMWMIVKFCDWTDGFAHRGLKSGTRIAAALYLIAVTVDGVMWCGGGVWQVRTPLSSLLERRLSSGRRA